MGQRKIRPIDHVYFRSLNALVDRLFQEAFRQKVSFSDMARNSELSEQTIRRLAGRVTKWPQLRTVELLAHSLGTRLAFKAGVKHEAMKKTWTIKMFAKPIPKKKPKKKAA
jgi:pyruvate-formate lyase